MFNVIKDVSHDAFQMLSSGESEDNLEYNNLEHYYKKRTIASNEMDYAKMSAATVGRIAKAGGITKDTTNKIFNSVIKMLFHVLRLMRKRMKYGAICEKVNITMEVV